MRHGLGKSCSEPHGEGAGGGPGKGRASLVLVLVLGVRDGRYWSRGGTRRLSPPRTELNGEVLAAARKEASSTRDEDETENEVVTLRQIALFESHQV